MPKPNWKLIEPFIKAVRDLEFAIAEADRIGGRAWDYECTAAEERNSPSGNLAFQHLNDALKDLDRAREAVVVVQGHLRKITSNP